MKRTFVGKNTSLFFPNEQTQFVSHFLSFGISAVNLKIFEVTCENLGVVLQQAPPECDTEINLKVFLLLLVYSNHQQSV